MTSDRKIVVGMSGGVDSSITLVLLKKQGWSPIGVSLKYAVWRDKANLLRENICCSKESFQIAKRVCQNQGVPHHIFNVADEFKRQVIDYFVKELKRNRTPNPCIICNRYLKLNKLFQWAKERKIKYIATGHYAGKRKNPFTNKYELLTAKDKNKDQTYFLSFLPQKWLRHIKFPLGNYLKSEIYKMAQKDGLNFLLEKKQSQDFCFVAQKSINDFLKKKIGENPGAIKNTKGKTLGKHSGLHFYTIGQRKGINLSGGPYYVVKKDKENNTLIVTKNKKELKQKKLLLQPFHFISSATPKVPVQVQAKIRYHHSPAPAVLFPPKENKLKLVFDQPQIAVTPGQFAVFYCGQTCLGSGRII